MSIDMLEKNLSRSHEWIRSADQKASIWLTFQGVFLSTLFFIITKVDIQKYLLDNYFCVNIIIFSSVSILYLYSLLKAIFSIIPVVRVNVKETSMIYFSEISNLKLSDYKKKMKEYDNTDYEEDLLNQIHTSSSIANKKHDYFWDSVYIFMLAVSLMVFFAFIKFILTYNN